MSILREQLMGMLRADEFPRTERYDPTWIIENQMGPNVLWLTEWLCQAMDLSAGMRILDLGCGKAVSSVFLAREFGVQVWATDLWIQASDNLKRLEDAKVSNTVFPIHAEARALPYAERFFDAIVSLDSYHYYGTDDLYLTYITKFLRPGGQIGIVVPGLMRDFSGGVPEHLARRQKSGGVFWGEDCWSIHTLAFWKRLWGRTNLVDVEVADTLPGGCNLWLKWQRALDATGLGHFPSDAEALEADGGKYLGFVRMVARRKEAK